MMIDGVMVSMIDMLGAVDPLSIIKAGMVLLGVGFSFVVILNIANAKLKVEVDPMVEAILNILPGANCGGCGLAGCGAYAEAVAKDHGLMGKCGPGGEDTVREVAAILGIEAAASAPVRAIVHCAAKGSDKINSARYFGIETCGEAQMVAGAMGCPYGCLGFGDCGRACEFDAIDFVEGLTTINYHKCVGCGACVKVCPRQLIELLPFSEDPMLVISCSSLDKAKEVKSYCKVGCMGCSICAKKAPNTFQMQQNLAVIDYKNYGSMSEREAATEKCPRTLMVYVGKEEVKMVPAATAEETTS